MRKFDRKSVKRDRKSYNVIEKLSLERKKSGRETQKDYLEKGCEFIW